MSVGIVLLKMFLVHEKKNKYEKDTDDDNGRNKCANF